MPSQTQISDQGEIPSVRQAKEATNQPFFASAQHAQPGKSAQAVFFQPKLTINEPDDKHEQEADAKAEQLMRMSATPSGEEAGLHATGRPLTVIGRFPLYLKPTKAIS